MRRGLEMDPRGLRLRHLRPNEALYNTTRWRKLRREVLREIGQCVICGATDNLHVHHITPPKGDEALFYSAIAFLGLYKAVATIDKKADIQI